MRRYSLVNLLVSLVPIQKVTGGHAVVMRLNRLVPRPFIGEVKPRPYRAGVPLHSSILTAKMRKRALAQLFA